MLCPIIYALYLRCIHSLPFTSILIPHTSIPLFITESRAEITLKLVMELKVQADGGISFVLPTVLNPRYCPPGHPMRDTSPHGRCNITVWSLGSDIVVSVFVSPLFSVPQPSQWCNNWLMSLWYLFDLWGLVSLFLVLFSSVFFGTTFS